jgi:hypothetical protein
MNDSTNPNGASRPLPEAASKSQQEWREYCAELLAEIEGLHELVAKLREEKRGYASLIPVPDEIKQLAELGPEKLMAMSDSSESFEDWLRKIEQGEDV